MPRTILITGASSGIGRALALHLAQPGRRLGLLARNRVRLDQTAAQCRDQGAEVQCASIDVRDRAAMKTWIEDFDRAAPVDLLIANAGVLAGVAAGESIEASDPAHELMQTNVLGVLNTVQPLLPAMTARSSGQIAIVSSLAGFTPLPDAPSYAASKSAVLAYGLSLRALLARHGVGVSVVCLGYVDTPMARRESGRKPFQLDAATAAARMCRGIERNRATIVIPRFFGMVARIGGLLPDRMRQWVHRPFRVTVGDRPPDT